MKLHLVGGFLGSGKTTAIIQAARLLMREGQRVGVVTNDQGKYLVDTAFVRLADIPAVEVTGGCFCCNYNDLDSSLDQLIASAKPDVIFAESVGSCADLVATVVKPLIDLKQNVGRPTSFSVFTDGRMLRRRLRDDPMPFSDDVVYIYDKQIEEAGLVIVNKIDLMAEKSQEETMRLLKERYPDKALLSQSSLSAEGVAPWLAKLESGIGLLPEKSLEIDYQRYGHGEAQLAWLDETVRLHGADSALAIRRIISTILDALKARGAAIGHLKYLLQAEGFEGKISFPTLDEPGWESILPVRLEGEVVLTVNARVEMPADELRSLFQESLRQANVEYREDGISYFHPKQPSPTYRYA